jgi:GTPase SAR1 family protein
MNLTIKQNPKPNLKIDKMLCDIQLDDKLNDYEITKFLNRHTTNCFLGVPGSGKTTLLNSLFRSKNILKSVFHDIYLFQPSHSRTSMKNDIWEKGIKPENRYDDLNFENLTTVLDTIKSQEKTNNSCIIFDDVGSFLKEKEIVLFLKDAMANHRHYSLRLYFCVQTIKMLPFELRRMMDNLFVFRSSKETLNTIFEEYLELENKKKIERI